MGLSDFASTELVDRDHPALVEGPVHAGARAWAKFFIPNALGDGAHPVPDRRIRASETHAGLVHDARMSRISVLPDAVASRIAAGEVVERPSSVVKELVENAIDAGATRISVELEEGGRRRIAVVDDGCGMDRDDALLSFEQHATSKVSGDGDLSAIRTRGFRGEALPAIASVARVTLTTAEAAGEGTRVRIDFGKLRDVSATGAPRGTSVEVKDLFGELPARRKFLRSSATELSHALRFLEQQALALPLLQLSLAHDGRTLLDAPPAQGEDARIRHVFGEEFAATALRVGGRDGDLDVRAWLLRSGAGAGRIAQLTILLNGRPITDRLLSHAVREAARRLFGEDVAPAGVVLIDIDPLAVDVNVHPAKREVRFARPGEVHDTVRDLIRADALARGALKPAVDADLPGRIASVSPTAQKAAEAQKAGEAQKAAEAPGLPWETRTVPAAGSGTSERRAAWEPSPASPLDAGRRILGQHRNTYVVAEDEQGLLLVDQHCAHERILYEKFLDGLGRDVSRQALLQPAIVELPRSLGAIVMESLEDLGRLGFEIEPFGGGSFAVRAIPAAAGTADPAELLREMASHEEPGAQAPQRIDRLAATMACKAAVKAGFPLGHERMKWLVEQLLLARVPTTCPHGRVAMLRLSDRDLDHRFGRI